MPVDDILLEAEEKMIKSVEHVQTEFTGVRTGKASPALVENVMIDAYGSQMRLKELAGITAPENRMLVVQPWDATTLDPIDKGLQKANMGLNPMKDGKIIRIVMPELSEERRQEFVKIARKMAEDGRVATRHVRRDAIQQLKDEAKAREITEDDKAKGEKDVQKLTNDHIKQIDDHLAHKEEEIMTV